MRTLFFTLFLIFLLFYSRFSVSFTTFKYTVLYNTSTSCTCNIEKLIHEYKYSTIRNVRVRGKSAYLQAGKLIIVLCRQRSQRTRRSWSHVKLQKPARGSARRRQSDGWPRATWNSRACANGRITRRRRGRRQRFELLEANTVHTVQYSTCKLVYSTVLSVLFCTVNFRIINTVHTHESIYVCTVYCKVQYSKLVVAIGSTVPLRTRTGDAREGAFSTRGDGR